jgi:zinc protease
MLMEGTATKTPEELEEEIDLLGANINVWAGTEDITVSVNSLTRNYEKTLALVEEILLQPRWDEEQFELVKSRMINNVKRNEANPNYLAMVAFDKLVYGDDNILAMPSSGTVESLESITMDDLKDFYKKAISPSVARMHVVGKIDHERVVTALTGLSTKWEAHDVVFPEQNSRL